MKMERLSRWSMGLRLTRRMAVFSLPLALTMLSMSGAANAGFKFTKNITIIFPYGVGGSGDNYARVMANALKDKLGVPVIVLNRVGGNGTVGMSAAARSTPDGYTFLLAANTLIMGQYIYDLDFKPFTDLIPVGSFAQWGSTLLVRNEIPATNALEYLKLAEARPNSISFGSGGVQVIYQVQLMAERLPSAKIKYVPYRGEAEMLTNMLGGSLDSMLAINATAVQAISTGKIRAIGLTSPVRSALLPDVAPIADVLPGYSALSWFGFFAPTGTPTEAIDTLYSALSEIVKQPATRETVGRLGYDIVDRNGAQFTQFLHEEDDKFSTLSKTMNLKSLIAQ